METLNSNQSRAKSHLNPIWTGLFANIKRLGHFAPPPNLAISSQMMMKLGKDYTMGRNLYRLTKIFDDVIVMLIL